jgi:2-methylcitrate dehydratase PrpD
MNLRRYDYPAARVTLSLRDGRTLSESVVTHHGDYQSPASRQELEDKFTFLAQDTLREEQTKQVIETVDRLDTLEDIRELTALLRHD